MTDGIYQVRGYDMTNITFSYLCADALEQLGYQAESGPWRNAYLSAASELRNGTNTDPATRANGNADAMQHMSSDMLLDYLGILVDGTQIGDLSFTANIVLPSERYLLIVKNGVILYEKDAGSDEADVTWETDKRGLFAIVQKNAEGVSVLVRQTGDERCLPRLMDAVTVFADYKFFNIIEP